MRMLLKIRSVKKWLIIGFLTLTFFLGNMILLKPWKSSKDNSTKNDNDDGLNISERYTQVSKNRNQDGRKENDILSEKKKIQDPVEHSVVEGKKHVLVKPVPPKINHKNDPERKEDSFKHKIAVLVIACNRPTVSRCLDQILKYKPKNIDIPVIVSQDCGDKETESVIMSYGNKVKLYKQPDLSDVKDVPENMAHYMGYYKISRHYKFALTQAFNDGNIDSVIIIEDDLDIAPDFFEYFLATRPLLDLDKSIWCVSAWNDNGKEGFVKGNELLHRTDFFPGLGWMITRDTWNELKSKWPKGFWDDWMRDPKQRHDRACIRPEISRSKTFGKIGVSMGQFYDQYLKFIKLNDEFYPFRKTDLTYLLKRNYDKEYIKDVYSNPVVRFDDVISGNFQGEKVRVQYESDTHLEAMTRQFNIMTDLKAGVPRTAYKGIISFVRDDKRIFLTPYHGWTGYNET